MTVNQVPLSFQTDKYKNEILPNQLSQDFEFMENLITSQIEQVSSSNVEVKKTIELNKSYKSTNAESKKISDEEVRTHVFD